MAYGEKGYCNGCGHLKAHHLQQFKAHKVKLEASGKPLPEGMRPTGKAAGDKRKGDKSKRNKKTRAAIITR